MLVCASSTLDLRFFLIMKGVGLGLVSRACLTLPSHASCCSSFPFQILLVSGPFCPEMVHLVNLHPLVLFHCFALSQNTWSHCHPGHLLRFVPATTSWEKAFKEAFFHQLVSFSFSSLSHLFLVDSDCFLSDVGEIASTLLLKLTAPLRGLHLSLWQRCSLVDSVAGGLFFHLPFVRQAGTFHLPT